MEKYLKYNLIKKIEPICLGFVKNYKILNLKNFKITNQTYIIQCILIELTELFNGYKITKINKATNKGTIIKFKKIENDEFQSIWFDIRRRLKETLSKK